MRAKLAVLGLLAVLASGCKNGPDVVYRPYPQILPQHITKISVQPFVNKTAYFGLEDRLTQQVINEFLKNGNYAIVPESEANGIVLGEIRRYILTPVQYDAARCPRFTSWTYCSRCSFTTRPATPTCGQNPPCQAYRTTRLPPFPAA